MKKKIRIFGMAIFSIRKQLVGSSIQKLKFIGLVVFHYVYKILGIKRRLHFPAAEFRLKNISLLTRADTIDFWACLESYEPDLTYFLTEIISNRKGTFIDVGGHIGRFTVLMAKNGWKTITFEPMESNYLQLNENLRHNGCATGATVYNLGLGSENRSRTIYFDPDEMGEASLVNSGKSSSTEIRLVRFDDFMKDVRFDDFCIVKMDIEGNEERALNGMKEFLGLHKPLLVIELWREHSGNLILFLKSIGYKRFHVFWYMEEKHSEYIAGLKKLYDSARVRLNEEGELIK